MTTNRMLLPLARAAVNAATKHGHFMAPSARPGNGPYRLTIVNGTAVACGCKGYNFNGKCYHMTDFNALAAMVRSA